MRTATIYNFLLEANIMASIAILLMLPIRRWLRGRLGNRVICFAWLMVAIRLLCPLSLPNPAIHEIRPPAVQDQAIRPIAGQIQVRLRDLSHDAYRYARDNAWEQTAEPAVDTLRDIYDSSYNGMLSIWLMQAYLAGVLLVLLYFVAANARFRHRLRAGRIEAISGKLLEQYQALCAARRVKPIPVYFTDPLPSACLVGAIRPYIALPLTAKPQDAIHVLTHEVCHMKGHDNWWGVLRLLCCAIHWFNPLVWLAASLSRTDGELACDERVAARLDSQQKLAYANVLVLAAAKRNAPGMAVLATGMTMTGRKLKTRVSAILHSGRARKWLAIVFAALCCVALVCAFMTRETNVRPNIPSYGTGARVAQRTIGSDEQAIAYAQELWQNPYLDVDVSDVTWSVRRASEAYIVECVTSETALPLTLNLLPDGTITFLNNAPSGIAGMHNDGTLEYASKAIDEIGMFLLDFCDAVQPGLSNDIEGLTFIGEGEQGTDRRFARFVGISSSGNGDYRFGVQVAPEMRVASFSVDQRILDARAQADATEAPTPTPIPPAQPVTAAPGAMQPLQTLAPTAAPIVSAAGESVLVSGFTATNKAPENDSFTLDVPADALSLEDALGFAVRTIMSRYGENESSLTRFALDYGYRVGGNAYFQTPYWQFDFRNASDPLDSYEIMIHSPDGAVLYAAGPGEGNG